MKEYKIYYTKEELKALIQWFADHPLPDSLRVDKVTYIPNLSYTVKCLLLQAEIYQDNYKIQGSILLLDRIKRKLEEESSDVSPQEIPKA